MFLYGSGQEVIKKQLCGYSDEWSLRDVLTNFWI